MLIPLLAILMVLLLTPLIMRIAPLDWPEARKIHCRLIPRWGGIAIYAALLVGLSGTLWRLYISMSLLLLVGLIDDWNGMNAFRKLGFQLLVALFFVGEATWTVLWIVLLTNSINLIDGSDGLAASLSVVMSSAGGFCLATLGQDAESTLLFALAGGLLGFLVYNWHPARIFLGDSGSLLIGFVLATATLPLGILAQAGLFAIPLLDTGLAIWRRGLTPWIADRYHLHHRLLALGWSQPAIALLFLLVSLSITSGVLYQCV